MPTLNRTSVLNEWVKPSSDHEKDQQDRAERMVRDAIAAHPAFDGVGYRIYTKGSYPNNTNVRRDSDVDVVVELYECIYFDVAEGVTLDDSSGGPYTGTWTRDSWRAEVKAAMVAAFGADGIDASGKIAIEIQAVAGSRPSADVVPSFEFRRYTSSDRSAYDRGSCVWSTDLEQIVNWPQQQLENGRAKNNSTNCRYKKFVRALKNAENVLVAEKVIDDLPSYFMECLVYNVSDETLMSGATLEEGFEAALVELWNGLTGGAWVEWVEPNWKKWLFLGAKKWDIEDGKKLVSETWNYLGYGDD